MARHGPESRPGLLRNYGPASTGIRNPDFFEVVLAPDLAITMPMIELISSSPNAADIAYYLGKNKATAAEIARLPFLRQAEEIRKIEQTVQAAGAGL